MSLDGLGESQQLDDLNDPTEDDAALLQDDNGDDPNSAMEEDDDDDYANSNDDTGSMKDDSQSHLDLAQNFSFLDPSLFDYTWTNPAEPSRTSTTRGNVKRKSSMGESSDGSFFDPAAVNNNHSSAAVASRSETQSYLTDTMMFARGGGTIARRLAANNGSAASVTNSNTHNSSESGDTNRSTTTSVTTAASSQQTAATTNNHALGSTSTIIGTSSKEAPHHQHQDMKPVPATANATVVTDASSAAAVAMASLFAAHQAATTSRQQQQQPPPSSTNNNNNNNMFFDPNLLPLALNAMAAAGNGTTVAPTFYQQSLNTGHQQHQVPAASATIQPLAATATAANPQPQAFTPPPAFTPSQPPVTATTAPSVGAITTSNTTQASAQQTTNALPPFLLFDAPIELRANFMAAQRALGMSPLQDNNSVHYGLPGSQHQQRRVRLVDGRHCDLRNKRVKNEREQKRTQKISDLIDHLRVKMEHGGWKVGLKSKFHTLSSCAEYVKHLKQVNKEKEEALEKATNDLEEKQRKMEDDNRAQQEGPSDPESTTSSLTVSSASEGRKTASAKKAHPEPAGESKNSKRIADDGEGNKKPAKMSRLGSHESSDISSFDDGGGKPPAQLDEDQFVNVSDITDSNKDSSSDGNSSSGCQQQRSNTSHKASRSTSPNAEAAAAARDCSANRNEHSTVVFEGRKRKSPKQATRSKEVNKSLKFELDYEEVFIKSNVPQILATTSGRIVAWNDFFLKATSLTAKEIDRLTIFSLVQPSKLSKLFEIFAAALRYGTLETDETSEGKSEQDKASSTEEMTEPSANKSDKKPPPIEPRKGNYTAITLPCANFGIRPKPADGSDESKDPFTIKPLYMTVTLMADEDPRKRCFHCVLTDCPGTNGSLGRITPELLSLLFH